MEMLYLALVVLLMGALLVWSALSVRKREGLGSGETVALDDLEFYSERLQLVGRPDRIERQGDNLIPEEWKPTAKRVYPGHRLQLGCYFILLEEVYGVRPPFGVVVIRDGERVEVENTDALRSEVQVISEKIRQHRRRIEEEIPVSQPVWKCRACGQRANCSQNSA